MKHQGGNAVVLHVCFCDARESTVEKRAQKFRIAYHMMWSKAACWLVSLFYMR